MTTVLASSSGYKETAELKEFLRIADLVLTIIRDISDIYECEYLLGLLG